MKKSLILLMVLVLTSIVGSVGARTIFVHSSNGGNFSHGFFPNNGFHSGFHGGFHNGYFPGYYRPYYYPYYHPYYYPYYSPFYSSVYYSNPYYYPGCNGGGGVYYNTPGFSFSVGSGYY
jgi:hypothetical protein